MAKNICSVDGCTKFVVGRGMCSAHYQRWRKRGSTDLPAKPARIRRVCSVDDCSRVVVARGWCDLHYDRWRQHGDPGDSAPKKVTRYPAGTLCKIETCERPVLARGWCQKHYARWRQTGGSDVEIDDLRYQRITGGPCSEEGCSEPVACRGLCRNHYQNQRNRRWREAEPEKYRNYHMSRYGITGADYDVLLAKQDGKCAICRQECLTGKRLQVDHDHDTNEVRGLLCFKCNVGLGKFDDDPDLLVKAAEYLRSC